MSRLATKTFPQELLDCYDYYAYEEVPKREFFNLAAKYAVGGMTVLALFDLLRPDYVLAAQVEFTDPEIVAEYIMYPSPNGHSEVRGYLVKPAKMSGETSAIVAVYESRGLNPYIEDMTWWMVKKGYIALAPDGLSSVSDYPGNDDKGRELQRQVGPTKLMNDFFAATGLTQCYPQVTGKMCINESCHGGGVSNAAAAVHPELACAVPFYGRRAPTADVAKIEAPLLFHYTELDNRVDEGWPVHEAALKANNKVYEVYIYPGVNHGFHNDLTPRYDKSAVDLAWQRTLK